MTSKRKICVMTGTRADYGLLYWTMKEIQQSEKFELQIIATCMHLSPKFGNTWEKIVEDGFEISKKVNIGEQGNTRSSIARQVGTGVGLFFDAFNELNPDLIIILGDRYEMLAAAQAAVFSNIPIAHIHGGEITEGAFDDIIRHSITKMSTFHFTSTKEYRARVIQMGESPDRVLNIGAVGLEAIRKCQFLPRETLEQNLGFKLKEKNFLITYHPVTAANEDAIENLIKALEHFPDCAQIITMPNSDPGHDQIFEAFKKYARDRDNVYLSTNLGLQRYLSAMKIVDIVIGNSSSGIIEAPFIGTPTLNIGVRQKGRLSADSVIHCGVASEDIRNRIDRILSGNFGPDLLYGDGYCAEKLVTFLNSKPFVTKVGFYVQ